MMTLDSAPVPRAKHPARGKRIMIDNVFNVLRMAEGPAGAILNKLTRKRYGNYRNASTIINSLVHCGMIIERFVRDERQMSRVSCAITEKCNRPSTCLQAGSLVRHCSNEVDCVAADVAVAVIPYPAGVAPVDLVLCPHR